VWCGSQLITLLLLLLFPYLMLLLLRPFGCSQDHDSCHPAASSNKQS
jgi:hypothetical protein